jgi:hypothetical protein
MPKTYNARQIASLKMQAAHAAPVPDAVDMTRHVRYFSPTEIVSIITRIEQRVAVDKPTISGPTQLT